MQSYTIHFIRHGLTEANITGKYAGVWDIPVCEEGKEKLKNLRTKHNYPKVDKCYSSPLTRCLQTCEIIYPEMAPEIIEDLKECDFGEWEGKSHKELLENPQYIEWIKNNRESSAPGGESKIEFGKRICNALETIVDTVVRNKIYSSAIFTHGGVLSGLLSVYGIPRAKPLDWMVDNGCGYSVRVMPGLWMRDKVFEVYAKIPEGVSGEISGNFKDLMEGTKK